MSEDVLVVRNDILKPYIDGAGRSFITEGIDRIYGLILGDHTFMPREKAEYNFEHKQIIPYVVIHHKADYLLLQRTSKQTEKRLHNKFSLGIGGHINPNGPASKYDVIVNGLYRELNEEVSLPETADLRYVGIINDESNSVSKVHLGLLYILETVSTEYEILEKDKMTARWIPGNGLAEYYPDMETWSQIVYDQYIKAGSKESRGQGVK